MFMICCRTAVGALLVGRCADGTVCEFTVNLSMELSHGHRVTLSPIARSPHR